MSGAPTRGLLRTTTDAAAPHSGTSWCSALASPGRRRGTPTPCPCACAPHTAHSVVRLLVQADRISSKSVAVRSMFTPCIPNPHGQTVEFSPPTGKGTHIGFLTPKPLSLYLF
jgi:hypothetical protein